MILSKRLKMASQTLNGYSAEILAQIDAGMSPLPKDRPQSIAEWASITTHSPELASAPSSQQDQHQADEPTVAYPKIQPQPLWERLSQEQKIASFAVLGLIIVGIAFFPKRKKT